MKHFKGLGVASALIITVFGFAGSAQATQLTPTGAERTFSSTSFLLSMHGGGTVRCTSSTLTVTIPATSSTWVALSGTWTNSGCTANGALPATVSLACSWTLHAMGIGSNQAIITMTQPAACAGDMNIPSIGCTLTVNGPKNWGNGTTGFGGAVLTGGATPTIHFNNTTVPEILFDGPTTAACVTNATHTTSGTLTGTYTGNGTVDVDGS